MPFDAVCLRGVVEQLQREIVGGRVDKIYQPGRDEILLSLHGDRGTRRLLLSANPSGARLQLTAIPRENPATPPMFCMLLRKHLTGAKILSLTQPPMERSVTLELEARDELGARTRRKLVRESMGRYSNLILVDGEGRIMDCLRRVDAEMSPLRQVLPGLFYHEAPRQEGKINPLTADGEFLDTLLAATPGERKIAELLLDSFYGLSPLICREFAFQLTGDVDGRLWETDSASLKRHFASRMADIREGKLCPTVIFRNGKLSDFTYCPILQYGPESGGGEPCEDFCTLLDSFYAQRESAQRIRQRGGDLLKAVTARRDRAARKVENQRRELAQAENREELRIRGDLITANLYAMKKGMTRLTCVNYYDPEGGELTIPLDPLLTPQQNAALCYKKYNKAKTAQRVLTEQIALGEADRDYLDSVLTCIRCSTEDRDLTEIRLELENGGYLKPKRNGKKQMKQPRAQPLEFRTPAGLRMSVGRNNLQNDRLTLKTAGKTDLWLHTKALHGAHVILWTEGRQPDAESLMQAAQLAAWYSQGREESAVDVDCTQVRHVKKPAGAKPGGVIYTHYTTLRVSPKNGDR